MKFRFFFFLFLFLFPFFSFAQSLREFTVTEDLRSQRAIDDDFTSAWYDGIGKRIILSRDYSVQEASLLALDQFTCKAEDLVRQFAFDDLTRNIECRVIPDGFLVSGFFQERDSRNFVGRIYLIRGAARTLISQDSLFKDRRLGDFVIGIKHSDEFFIIFKTRSPKFFEFKNGAWREIKNEELAKLRVSDNLQIAWSGNAWFFSRGRRDLSYFDGTLLVDAAGQIPVGRFSINQLETDVLGEGMLFSDGRTVKRVKDNGYKGSLSARSRSIHSKGKGEIIKAILAPEAVSGGDTSIQYFVSATNGKRWSQVFPGQEISMSEAGADFLWEAVLQSSSSNKTAVLKKIQMRYTVKGALSRNERSSDSKRARDLQKVARLIKDYERDTGHFPIISEFHTAEDRWKDLQRTLLESAEVHRSKGYARQIEKRFPFAPRDDKEAFQYDVRADDFGKNYLLFVELEQGSSKNLKKDLDGFVLNANCDDPVFCIAEGAAVNQEIINSPQELLIKLSSDYRVYWVRGNKTACFLRPPSCGSENKKRWIINPQVFEKHKFKWEKIRSVSKQEFDRYETADPLRN